MFGSAKHYIDYEGKLKQVYGIWTVNLFMKIITIGIYSFWGKARMRRYLAHSFYFADDRFHYTGTGRELFMGFLRALPMVLVLYLPIFLLDPLKHPQVQLLFIGIYFVVCASLFSATRYRYSRTSWRGIRGRLTGSPWKYAAIRLGGLTLSIFTLGIMKPFADAWTRGYMVRHSYLGNVAARFEPKPSQLIGINMLTLLLAVFTLGLSRFWYRAACNRHFASATHIGALQLENSQSGGQLFRLVMGNAMIAIFTMGIGMPVIINRSVNFLANTLSVNGDLHAFVAEQSQATGPSHGEGIDGILGDHDFGFL